MVLISMYELLLNVWQLSPLSFCVYWEGGAAADNQNG
jgi:hypothetical protein